MCSLPFFGIRVVVVIFVVISVFGFGVRWWGWGC